MEDKVLAVVNGYEIKDSDVKLLYSNLGPNAAQYNGERGYKELVNQLVIEEMLYQDAKERNLEVEEGYLKALEQLKKSLLSQYSVSKLMSEVEVSDKEAMEYYDSNRDRFKEGETANASHILVKSEDDAKKILEEIKNGLDFAEAAMKYSDCPSKEVGGNLGNFARGRMVPEFEDAVFAMKVGELSEPVRTQFGYHIIRVDEKHDARDLTFEEVKTEIVNKLKYTKQSQAYTDKQEALKAKYAVEYHI